jgi:hypothetical protein
LLYTPAIVMSRDIGDDVARHGRHPGQFIGWKSRVRSSSNSRINSPSSRTIRTSRPPTKTQEVAAWSAERVDPQALTTARHVGGSPPVEFGRDWRRVSRTARPPRRTRTVAPSDHRIRREKPSDLAVRDLIPT